MPISNRRIVLVLSLLGLSLFPFGAFSDTYFRYYIAGFSLFLAGTSVVFYGGFRLALRKPSFYRRLASRSEALLAWWYALPTAKLLCGVFLFYFLLCAGFSAGVFHSEPLLADSQAQYAHGRIISQGHFTIPSHPRHEFFDIIDSINYQGRWFSQYPPGHTMMLALGHLAGVPWAVNPLLGAASLILIFLLARECFGEKTARLSLLLGVGCTQLLIVSSEYKDHATGLFGVMLFLWGYARVHRNGAAIDGLLAGAGLAIAFLARPWSVLGIALPFALHGAYYFFTRPRKFFVPLMGIVLVMAGAMALQMAYNSLTTGDSFLYSNIMTYGKEVLHLGVSWKGEYHGIWRGIGNISNNAVSLNLFLFFWPVPCLLFVFTALLDPPGGRWFWLFAAGCASLFFIFMPYHFQDMTLGARYMHEASGLLVILTAIGMRRLPSILRRTWLKKAVRAKLREQMRVAVSLMTIYTILVCAALASHDLFMPSFDHDLIGWRDVAWKKKVLIFSDHYQFVSYLYPQDEQGIVIFAEDLGDRNRLLMDYYPDRVPYFERDEVLYDAFGQALEIAR